MKLWEASQKRGVLVIAGLILLVALIGLGIGLSSTVSAEEDIPVVYDPLAISKIADRLAPSVVSIETTFKAKPKEKSPFNDPNFRKYFGLPEEPEDKEKPKGYGSGFIVDRRGYIVTNYHVVQNADTIEVKLLGDDKTYKGKLLDGDPDVDIAIIKIDANSELRPAPMGSSDKMRVGEWVVAIGNPLGMTHTVTVGVISAKGRQVQISNNGRSSVYDDLIQTDAAINPGNSGGPLINLKGQVIGINSAVSTNGQGIGFAQPIDKIRDFVTDVIAHGKSPRPWLGVVVTGLIDLDDETRSYFGLEQLKSGVFVTEVSADSPAEEGKIQKYDVILEFNKKPLKTGKDLVNEVRASKPGQTVTLLLQRQGKVQAVKVKIGDKPRI